MKKYALLLLAGAALALPANSASAATFSDLDISFTRVVGGTRALFETTLFWSGTGGFEETLTSYLASKTADDFFSELVALAGAPVTTASSFFVRYSPSYNYKFANSGNNEVVVTVNGNPVSTFTGFKAAPGPIAGAGLPVVLGLLGFAAWRRRHANA